METLSTPVRIFDPREPIPGYVVRERLGSGGYGEVWKADAPGGLTKAVKIVFGTTSADMASRELKALQRIKEVRHPMLLSLERIELVNDHLIIVTELADASLRQRFNQKVAAGHSGIPRDELLAYLCDAADALDYLLEDHSLQHLDVKPENLLLVGDRVKVADFGLLRDLQETSTSLVCGLTPLYAAPELFEGRPNPRTDQYGLAIVYQELLTGESPFNGRTAAQLASQHLHSQPVLSPLPPLDQPIVARALSKSPDRRFPSCRALIDELMNAPKAEASPCPRRGAVTSGRSGTRLKPVDRLCRQESDTDHAASTDPSFTPYPHSRTVVSLPPIKTGPEEVCYRPALFVGIGGAGRRVLRAVRQRLHDRFVDAERIPAFQFLLFDTDVRAVSEATRGSAGALRYHETALLPLREPKEYRAKSQSLLEWMERRWLYNIPRSRRTNGIRPLGRLAFVDSFDVVLKCLRNAIDTATSPESIEASSHQMRLQLEPGHLRVFVIASSTGGTGSGMVLDMAYAIRTLLKQVGLSAEDLCGILVHGTPQRASGRDLAIASTLSFLSELQHFFLHGYPGEPTCELPAFNKGGAFRHTYLAHIGDDLDNHEYARALDNLAEYVYHSTATEASAFFDKSRRVSSGQTGGADGVPSVRTLGLSRIGNADDSQIRVAEQILCRSVIAQWTGSESSENCSRHRQTSNNATSPRLPLDIPPEVKDKASRCANQLGLSPHQLVREVQTFSQTKLGESAQQFLDQVVSHTWSETVQEAIPQRVRSTISVVDAVLDTDRPDVLAEYLPERLESTLNDQLGAACQEKREALESFLSQMVDTPSIRVRGALKAARWLGAHLARLQTQVNALLNRLQDDIQALLMRLQDEQLANIDSGTGLDMDSTVARELSEYARLRLHQLSHRAAANVLRALRDHVAESDRRLRKLSELLEELTEETGRADSWADAAAISEGDTPSTESMIVGRLSGRLSRLAENVDRLLDKTFLGRQLFSSDVGSDDALDLDTFNWALRKTARAVVCEDIRRAAAADKGDGSSPHQTSIRNSLERATPRLLACGGAKRLAIIRPEGGTAGRAMGQEVEALCDDAVTCIDVTGDQLSVCCEGDAVPLENIAASLIQNRRDYREIASRLRTRSDIQWDGFSF